MKRNYLIQANVSKDFKDKFDDTYNESGCNSKGEFQRVLIDNYLNPETIEKSKQIDLDRINELELQIEQLSNESVAITELQEQVSLLTAENQQLKTRPPETKEVPVELGEDQILIDLNPVQKALLARIVTDKAVLDNFTITDGPEYSESYQKFVKKWGTKLVSTFSNDADPQNVSKLLTNTFFIILTFWGSKYISNGLSVAESEIKDIIRENDEDFALAQEEKSGWEKFWE